MVTRAQVAKLDCRIDELATLLGTTPDGPFEFDVELVWLDDGALLDREGKPYKPAPGDIVLSFDS